jgi:hypothetical protein
LALSSGINVAAGKNASQSSSTWGQFYASKAVDNNPSTFSHTNDGDAWLEINLGQNAAAMESVNITNRFCCDINDASGCLCRLTNATVSLLDESSAVINEEVLGNTCGVLNVVNSFDSAPQFCDTTVSASDHVNPLLLSLIPLHLIIDLACPLLQRRQPQAQAPLLPAIQTQRNSSSSPPLDNTFIYLRFKPFLQLSM